MKRLIIGLLTIFISTTSIAQIDIIDTIRIAPRAGNGVEPTAVAINPKTNKAYIVNYETNNVSVMDVITKSIIDVIPNTYNAKSIAINDSTNRIYVLGDCMEVYVIDGNVDTIITTISLPLGGCVIDWRNIAVNRNTNRIYVTRGVYQTICIIDGATNSVIREMGGIGFYANGELDGIVIDLKTNKIYVTELASYYSDTGKVCVLDALTDSVIDTVNVGKGPKGITVSPSTGYIYVANYDTNTVSVINGNTDSVISTIEIDSNLSAITADSDYVYVTSSSNNRVYVIDGTTNLVVDTIDVENFPCGICVNLATEFACVTNKENNSVSIIDRINRSVDTSIIIGCHMWGKMGVNPNTNRIYAGDASSKNLFIINGATNKILRRMSISKGVYDIGIDSIRNKIYVVCNLSIYVIDGASDSIINIFDVADDPSVVCVNSLTGRLYISTWARKVWVIDTGNDSIIAKVPIGQYRAEGLDVNITTNQIYAAHGDTISVIDGATNCVIDTILIKERGYSISINHFTNLIYIALIQSGSIAIIDGITNNIVDSIEIGPYLHSVEVNPFINRIYVGKFDSSEIYAINGATNSVMGTVIFGKGPRDIVLNPVNQYLYVSCYYDGTVWVLDDKLGIEEESQNANLKTQKSKLNIVGKKIYLSMADERDVELKVYDLCGREREVVYEGKLGEGSYEFTPTIKQTGIYFITLTTGQTKETKKLILIK